MTPDDQREALKRWLDRNNLTPHSAAREAGIAPGAIYNFLAGTSKSLSAPVLSRLAAITGDPVDTLLTGIQNSRHRLAIVTHMIGGEGLMFESQQGHFVTVPDGTPGRAEVAAAIIEGSGLHPIPAGWAVFYEVAQCLPERLIGQLAVVAHSQQPRLAVRLIRRGTATGRFSLQSLSGIIAEDVVIDRCHRVVSMSAAVPVEVEDAAET